MRKTIAFALVLTLLLPIAAFWAGLSWSPNRAASGQRAVFAASVLDRDEVCSRLGLSDEKYRVRIPVEQSPPRWCGRCC